MHTLGIVGADASAVIDALADRLDGRVATIRHHDTTDAPADTAVSSDGGTLTSPAEADSETGTAASAYTLDADGAWTGRGTDRSLDDLLDDLAPDHDYALVAGFSDTDLPTVVLGEADVAGDVVEQVADADELNLVELADRIDDLEPHVTLETLVRQVKASPRAERAGAIATFTGRVRAKDSEDDSRTEFLEFEKYEGVAEQRMDAISEELTERDGVLEVVMHHRTGYIPYGDDIVFVVVLAGHRDEAFQTVEDGINRLKDEVPIFKKETTTDEEFWVHDRN